MTCLRQLCIVFFAAVFFWSCATKRPEVLLDTKATDAHTLIRLVEEQQGGLQSVVGRGTVTFESPEVAGTAAFELSLKKPDSLLVTFEGPFGIDLGTFFISKDKYLMYNSMENKVVTGVPNIATVRSIIPFDLTLDQIVGAFSGSFPFPASHALEGYTIDDEMFLLTFSCAGNLCKYWIDGRYLHVKKYEMLNDQNALVMDAVSSSFAEEDGTVAPKRIRIRFPAQGRQLLVNYSSIRLNVPNPSFAYSIPSTARTIVR